MNAKTEINATGFISELKNLLLVMNHVGFSIGHVIIIVSVLLSSITLIFVSHSLAKNLGSTQYQAAILSTVQTINTNLTRNFIDDRKYRSESSVVLRDIRRDMRDHSILTEVSRSSFGFDPHNLVDRDLLSYKDEENNYFFTDPNLSDFFNGPK